MSAPCDRPLDLVVLLDYWLDGEEGPAVDVIEEHLLGCASCSRELQKLAALGEGVRRLAQKGTFEMVVTPSFLAQATAQGLRTREYPVAPGGGVSCTVTPEDDFLVARLTGNFEGLTRLDVIALQEGAPDRRIEDVPIPSAGTELILAQAMPYVRTLAQVRLRLRLLGQDPQGERFVGEYTFDHSPTRL